MTVNYVSNFDGMLDAISKEFDAAQIRLDRVEEIPPFLENQLKRVEEQVQKAGDIAKASFQSKLKDIKEKALGITNKCLQLIIHIQTQSTIKVGLTSHLLLSNLQLNKAGQLSLLEREIGVLLNSPYLTDSNRLHN